MDLFRYYILALYTWLVLSPEQNRLLNECGHITKMKRECKDRNATTKSKYLVMISLRVQMSSLFIHSPSTKDRTYETIKSFWLQCTNKNLIINKLLIINKQPTINNRCNIEFIQSASLPLTNNSKKCSYQDIMSFYKISFLSYIEGCMQKGSTYKCFFIY